MNQKNCATFTFAVSLLIDDQF